MTKNLQKSNSLESAEPITVFEVSKGGTLRVSNYTEAETRADFYDYVASLWSRSQEDLAYAMTECQPLAWAVHSIYSEFRDEIEAELQDAQDAGGGNKRKLVDLEARLQAMPEEPEAAARVQRPGSVSDESPWRGASYLNSAGIRGTTRR